MSKLKNVQEVEDFYCKKCGSTTAIHIGNLELIRCMGCDTYYERGDVWTESCKPPTNLDAPPPASPC